MAEIRNPKSEIRSKSQIRNPKQDLALRFGFRASSFLRISDFGFRICGQAAIGAMLCLLCSLPASAAPVDRERLRSLAALPVPAMNNSIRFNEAYGFYLGWTKPDEMVEIVTLRRALRGDAGDAPLHRQIGKLYQSMQLADPARESFATAARLYFEQIKARPGDGWLRAQYADAWSESADRKRRAEAEPVFRHAVQVSPNDWRCWAAMGDYLQRAIKDRFIDDTTPDRRDPKVRQAELERMLNEARQCYEKAVAVAPQEPHVHAERAFARSRISQIVGLLRMRQGQRVNFYAEVFSPECIDDLKTVARLQGNSSSIGVAALAELLSVRLRQEGPPHAKPQPLPEPTMQAMTQARAALEKLAQLPDPRQAAEAFETMGMLEASVWGDDARAEADFRQAVTKDPTREASWHLLLITASRRNGPFVDICQERLKIKDSPTYHLQLANFYAHHSHTASLHTELEAALKADPKDFQANLAQAIYFLKFGEEKNLPEAMAYLARASDAVRELPVREYRAQYAAAQGFYHALTGNYPEARVRFKESLELDNTNEAVREALDLLGIEPPAGVNPGVSAASFQKR
jgi:tetratricopeptide (TPR) repeat protein